jgi:hypothetical protein
LQIEHVKRSVILLVSLFYFFLTALTWLLLLRPFQKNALSGFPSLGWADVESKKIQTKGDRSRKNGR